MNLPPIRVDFENAIKNYLKEHLKIEIEYTSPAGLCDGKIKATLKLDGEVIDSNEHKIFKSYF